MERYIRALVFCIFAMLGLTHGAAASEIASDFRLPLDDYPLNDSCLRWGGVNSQFPGKLHVADDACAPEHTPVFAVANGTVKYADSYTACPDWGYLIVIEHAMPNGSKVTSIYGHVIPDGITVGSDVSYGQYIGTIMHHCNADHIHFGIYRGPFSDIACYGPGNCHTAGYMVASAWPGNYENPTDFIEDHQVYCDPETFTEAEDDYEYFLGTSISDPGLYYDDSGDDVCFEDYINSGATHGSAAVIFDPSGGAPHAYLVRDGMWQKYEQGCHGPYGNCNQNGVVDCGPPITDEYRQSGNTSRQDFRTCYLYYNGSSVSANPYPGAAPGWFEGSGWNGSTSYAFAEAYEQNGARNRVGEAFNNGDGAGVHRWGHNNSLPWVQDFRYDAGNTSAIMYNNGKHEAYRIAGAMWTHYRTTGGPAVYGAPCTDEYGNPSNSNRYQQFEKKNFKWLGGSTVYVSSKSEGCNTSFIVNPPERQRPVPQSVSLASVDPCTSEVRDNLDNDCDGLIDEAFDLDLDGFSADQGDCDERYNSVHPGATEYPDTLDNDCDDLIDNVTWYEDQYLFFDADGNGDDDPCVRRFTHNVVCLCDGQYVNWYVPGPVVGTGEYLLWRIGRNSYYDYNGADGIADLVVNFGDGNSASEYLYWHTTIAVRYGNQLQLDRNLDGILDTYFTYGAGDQETAYYLADLNGDGYPDTIVRRGNLYLADTDGNQAADWSFTYGWSTDDTYFADLNGDGKDGIIVRRGALLLVNEALQFGTPNNPHGNIATYSFPWGVGM